MSRPERPDTAARLLADARTAARVRAHQTDPDVVALAVTRASAWIERAIWVAVVVGLCFTAASVHAWYTAGAPALSALWWTGWAVTPTVEIIAVAILRGEQILGRYGVTPGPRVILARRTLLTFALTLQLWGPLTTLGAPGPGIHGTVGNVVVHAVVLLAVIAGAEAITELRELLNRAITAAAETAAEAAAAARTGLPDRRRRVRHRADDGHDPAPDVRDRADDGHGDAPDDGDGDDSDDSDPEDTAPKGDAVRAWIARHWTDDQSEPPMPVEIQAGLLSQGVRISRPYASRLRTAAITARKEQTG